MNFGRTQIGVNLWASMASSTPPALDAPENLTQQTGTFIVGDAVGLTATTDDSDGHVTTGVEIYADDVLIGQMSESPEDVWKFDDEDIPAGSRTYRARRLFLGGGVDSSVQILNVLDVLAPDQVTSATWLAGYRVPESIQMASTTEATGTGPPVITLSSPSGLVRCEQLKITVDTIGPRGTAKINVFVDDMVVPRMAAVLTAPIILITGTDLTLNYSNASASANNVWKNVCNPWLDKVGAYPNSTNNFNNGTSLQRGYIIAAQNSPFGAPSILLDGVNDRYVCTGGLANSLVGGVNNSFHVFSLVYVVAVPGSSSNGTLWAASNLTNANIPLVEHVLRNTGTTRIWQVQRRSDAATVAAINSNLPSTVQGHLCEFSFDGTLGVARTDTADMIGGVSDVPANMALASAITPTQVSMGARQTQSGTTGFLSAYIFEQNYFSNPLSAVETIQHQRYYNS